MAPDSFVVLLLLLPTFPFTSGVDINEKQWTDFIRQYDKQYSDQAEVNLRKSIFISNLRKIEQHNALPNETYTKGINQFSDLTNDEFKTQLLTPELAFTSPIPDEPFVHIMSVSGSIAASVPPSCTRGSSNCCVSSVSPSACCSALGMGAWNRHQCDSGRGDRGVVPNDCKYHNSQCCRVSSNPTECCAALRFASWDNNWCRGSHAANVPTGCTSSNSHCCSESTLPQKCCAVLKFEYFDGAYCRNSASWYPAGERLANGISEKFRLVTRLL